jgi:hypothetical protein
VLGGVAYSKAELLAILGEAPAGDASIILAHQLITTLLNLENGANATNIAATVAAAQSWLATHADADGRLPYGSAASDASAATSLAATLDAFNNGLSGVPHCG